MRTLIVLPFLFAACQSGEPPKTDAQLLEDMRSTAVGFADALEHFDWKKAKGFAAPSAQSYFEVEEKFWALLFERPQRPPGKAALRSDKREGDKGVVEVKVEGRDAARSLFVHLQLEEQKWGVLGFAQSADGAPQLFADMEAGARQRLQGAITETTPHPEVGPLVEDYIAAAKAQNETGMTQIMTERCIEQERERSNAFTKLFLDGTIAIDRWQFRGYEGDGDRVVQRVSTMLLLKSGEQDKEPMTFEFVKAGETWRLDSLK